MDHPIRYQPLRAPRADLQALIQPPPSSLNDLLAVNRSAFASCGHVEIAGVSLAELRARTQRDLLQSAIAYTSGYRDLPACCENLPSVTGGNLSVLLSGHQPELFHPGVWFKNFALSEFGQQQKMVPINLVIDSDAARSTSIAIPTGTVSEPCREYVFYDQPSQELPHEERRVLDRECFASFGTRAAETIRPLVADPLVHEYWPLVTELAAPEKPLGETLAQARHRLEGVWGLQTLELPQSHVCRLPGFHRFTAHLLAHHARLLKFYNQSLAEYRQVHHLRTTAQPLPDLLIEDDWHEMPYWCWTKDDPQRRPLFVRTSGKQLLLTNRAGWEAAINLSAEHFTDRAFEELASFETSGVKLRTRALATTMFARLILSDLFLHGIGGAKYDQVTDRLIGLLFDLPAPKYMTLTATVKLPIVRPKVEPTDATRLRVQLRDLEFNPERFIKTDKLEPATAKKVAESIIAEKIRWIKTEQTPQNASSRHFEITKASAALHPFVAPLRDQLLAEQKKLAAQLHAESVLGSREYAFCLYEGETLRAQLLEILRTTF